MNWKDKAEARFSALRTPDTLVAIPVPQLDLTVYYWKAMNLEESREIYAALKSRGENASADLEAMATMLIVRARDKDGNKLFTKAERLWLMRHILAEDIAFIASQMETGADGIEEAEKNS
jgi:hypothetical protein